MYLLLNCITMLSAFFVLSTQPKRQFTIDYDNDRFLKDGNPYRFVSGSIHYFRVPPIYWRDRLEKMKAAGLNAVEFYVPWNLHEPSPGKFDFAGYINVTGFLDIVKELDLDVILRAGPYICGEHDNGGLPWWLLKFPDIRTRSYDPKFRTFVSRWLANLFPIVAPYFYENGGPIIMVQVENEYGSVPSSVGCDVRYTAWLRDEMAKHVGNTLLFTVDGGALGYLKCGFIPGVYPTVDFGPASEAAIEKSFQAQRTYAPRGPLVNTEFYPGWLQRWGVKDGFPSADQISKSMTFMYEKGASFNLYMFHGGTNFGYLASGFPKGAGPKNSDGWPRPVTTTYDYDAPISEAGDLTEKYLVIRDTLRNLTGKTPPPLPKPVTKRAYGRVTVRRLGTVVDLLNHLSPPENRFQSYVPLSMELIDVPYGFVLYETTIPISGNDLNLFLPGVKYHGYVMVDGEFQTKVPVPQTCDSTYKNRFQAKISARKGQKLQILTENTGRALKGPNDPKGIVTSITLNDEFLNNWTLYPIDLSENNLLELITSTESLNVAGEVEMSSILKFAPSIYVGTFATEESADTFFDPSNWGKGQFVLNDFNVGRYWPSLGPQVTLYTPKSALLPSNQIIMLELEQAGNCTDAQWNSCAIEFTDKPNIHKEIQTEEGHCDLH